MLYHNNISSMDVGHSRNIMDALYCDDPEKVKEALVFLKNIVIGSNKQKTLAVEQGVIPRLMALLMNERDSPELRTECVIVLNSLAKGPPSCVQQLVNSNIVHLLFKCVMSNVSRKFTECCLRCMSSVLQAKGAPTHDILTGDFIVLLLNVIMSSKSNSINVPTIFEACMTTQEHQEKLYNEGVVYSLAALLGSPYPDIIMPTLRCVASFCYENRQVAASIIHATFGGKSMPDLLTQLANRDKPVEMQLAAAKCLTHLHRAGALQADDPKIMYKALPVLIALCKDNNSYSWKIQVEAAETLAYLTEESVDLQKAASISNHLLAVMTSYVNCSSDAALSDSEFGTLKKEKLQAAFKVFASLSANDEEIRKQVMETDNLLSQIVVALEDSDDKVKLAAMQCLHSLSRSVHQLRTTFQDHMIWKYMMKLLESDCHDALVITSSTLCNLLLEFSPSKEPIVEAGAVDHLCTLTKSPNSFLRINGIWALMNMAYQSEQKIKTLILNSLGMEQIFQLLRDPEVKVVMKTLGLLRNLISTKTHIDFIMGLHGKDVMEAVLMMLNGNHVPEVKEQALCILANISDGIASKDYLMENDELLKKLMSFMTCSNVKLQIAATFVISNLVWKEESGALERQAKLKDMGITRLLQNLICTKNTQLFDKVKTALTQFSE